MPPSKPKLTLGRAVPELVPSNIHLDADEGRVELPILLRVFDGIDGAHLDLRLRSLFAEGIRNVFGWDGAAPRTARFSSGPVSAK